MRRSDAVVSKTELLDEVWGPDFEGDPNIVEVYIGYFRKKIDAPFGVQTILTVRGAGYRLIADPATDRDTGRWPTSEPRSSWGTVRLRITVAATVLVAAAMIVGVVAPRRERCARRCARTERSRRATPSSTTRCAYLAGRGGARSDRSPATSRRRPGYVVMLLDRDGRIVGGSRGYTGGHGSPT